MTACMARRGAREGHAPRDRDTRRLHGLRKRHARSGKLLEPCTAEA